MYEKQLYGRKVLYFRYAPPLTALDDVSDEDLPNKPFPTAAPYQRSVYYYWWLFLKENEGYMDCCRKGGKGMFAELYKDFGDIRGDDFFAWWKKLGRLLFCEPIQDQIEVNPARFDANDSSRVTVSIPLTGDIERTLVELKQLLKPLGKLVKNKRIEGSPKYAVAAKPVLTSLHQHHLIWTLKKQNPKLTLAELADLAKIGVSKGDGKDDYDVKSQKAIVVSRYLKQAKHLIEYVGKGHFPITDPMKWKKLNGVRK